MSGRALVYLLSQVEPGTWLACDSMILDGTHEAASGSETCSSLSMLEFGLLRRFPLCPAVSNVGPLQGTGDPDGP